MLRLHKMKVSGFFSYREPVEVDFDKLMEAGFFGILGPTGAGKSALLDCLLIALFKKSARTERSPSSVLNRTNGRQEHNGHIELEFTLGNQRYRLRYQYQSNGRSQHILYQGDSDQPLASGDAIPNKVAELLGMSYQHFTQTFLLEQGRFQEFLHATPKDRSDILASLLKLQHLDLSSTIESLRSEAGGQKSQLEQRKKELEEKTNPQREAEIRKEIEKIKEQKQKVEHQLNQLKQQLDEMAIKRQDWQKLNQVRQDLKKLQARREEFEKRKNRLEKFYQLQGEIRELFTQEREYQRLLGAASNEVKKLNSELESLRSESEPLFKRVKDLEPLYEEKSKYERLQQQIKSLLDYRDVVKEMQKEEKDIEDKREKLKELSREFEALKRGESQLQEQLKEVRGELSQLSMDLLVACKEWEDQKARVDQAEKKSEHQSQQLQSQCKQLWEGFQPLVKFCQEANVQVPACEASSEVWKETLVGLEEALHKALENERARFTHATWAYNLAATLRPGQPCPVCGSREHPEPASSLSSDAAREKELNEAIDKIRHLKDKYLAKIQSIEYEYRIIRSDMEECIKKLNKIEEQLRESFSCSPQPGLYKELRVKKEKLEAQVAEIEASINRNKEEQDKKHEAISKVREELSSLRARVAELQGRRSGLAQQIPTGGENWSDEEIKRRQEENERILGQIEQYYRLQQQAKEKENELRQLEAKCQASQENLERFKAQLAEVTQKLERAIQNKGLDLSEARQFYEPQVDWEKEKKEIEEFFQRLQLLQDQEKDLASSAQGYDPDLHTEKETEYKNLKAREEKILLEQGQREEGLRQLVKDREELERVQAQLSQLEKRYQHLDDLLKLFRGKKFMQFVLRQYVRRILAVANQYLRQWNGGLWELQLEKEESKEGERSEKDPGFRSTAAEEPKGRSLQIEVVDYVGQEYVPRSVKTLSGGQTFQASLALALALSDRVAARLGQKNQRSFLLIDEGFGSLDPDALSQVVSTLRQLAREGRAIGVITHREELKEHLDAYLLVRLEHHPQTGKRTSRIYPSWQRNFS